MPDEDFEEQYQELSSLGDDHVISVMEDESCGKTVTTGSVFIEKKFMRSCSKVGACRGCCGRQRCPGIATGEEGSGFSDRSCSFDGLLQGDSLDCSVEDRAFYDKCDFKQEEVHMVRQFV